MYKLNRVVPFRVYKERTGDLTAINSQYKMQAWGRDIEELKKNCVKAICKHAQKQFKSGKFFLASVPENPQEEEEIICITLDLDKSLKIQIRNILLELGISQIELCKKLNMHPSLLSKFLSFKKSTHLSTLEYIAKVLKLELEISIRRGA